MEKITFSIDTPTLNKLKRMYPRKGQLSKLTHSLLIEHALVNSIQRDPECYDAIAKVAMQKGLDPLSYLEIEIRRHILSYSAIKVRSEPERMQLKRSEVVGQMTAEQRRLLRRIPKEG